MPSPESAVSIPDAAAYMGIAVSTMYRLVDRQLIPVFRSIKGNRLRVRYGDLEILRLRMLEEGHGGDL